MGERDRLGRSRRGLADWFGGDLESLDSDQELPGRVAGETPATAREARALPRTHSMATASAGGVDQGVIVRVPFTKVIV
jgi:hypothetical protein